MEAHDSYAQELLSSSKFANKAISEEVFLSQRINNALMAFLDKDNPHAALAVMHWGMVSAFIQTLFVQFHGFGIHSYGFLRNAIEFLAIYSLALSNPSLGISWITNLKGRPEEYVQDRERDTIKYLKTRHGINGELFLRNIHILKHPFAKENADEFRAIIKKVPDPDIERVLYRLMPLSEDEKEKKQCRYKIACSYATHANFEGIKGLFQESEGGIELQPFPRADSKEHIIFVAGALMDFHDANVCIGSMTGQFVNGWSLLPDEFREVKHYVDLFSEEADEWPATDHSRSVSGGCG